MANTLKSWLSQRGYGFAQGFDCIEQISGFGVLLLGGRYGALVQHQLNEGQELFLSIHLSTLKPEIHGYCPSSHHDHLGPLQQDLSPTPPASHAGPQVMQLTPTIMEHCTTVLHAHRDTLNWKEPNSIVIKCEGHHGTVWYLEENKGQKLCGIHVAGMWSRMGIGWANAGLS